MLSICQSDVHSVENMTLSVCSVAHRQTLWKASTLSAEYQSLLIVAILI